MSYEFIKLSEVEQVETSYNANLIIEENGEIKRLPVDKVGGGHQQVQADWNETDDTSPAYIANKPDFSGATVVKYTLDCGGQMYINGEAQTVQQVADNWERGVTMRIAWADSPSYVCPVINCTYNMVSGSMQGHVYWIDDNGNLGSYYFH